MVHIFPPNVSVYCSFDASFRNSPNSGESSPIALNCKKAINEQWNCAREAGAQQSEVDLHLWVFDGEEAKWHAQ